MMKRILSLCAVAALCLAMLSACGPKDQGGQGGQEDKKVDLAAFVGTLRESQEGIQHLNRIDPNDAQDGELMENFLSNFYPGLTDLELEQMEVYINMAGINTSELALAQAKNADDAAKVKAIFQARVDSKSEDGQGNYPMEVEIWQGNAKVVENGAYVMLVCDENADAIVDEFNALFQ